MHYLSDFDWEECECGHLGKDHERARHPELGRCLLCRCKEFFRW